VDCDEWPFPIVDEEEAKALMEHVDCSQWTEDEVRAAIAAFKAKQPPEAPPAEEKP
jgi:hypothetical protein